MKSPINFKDFAANPLAGGLFFCIIAIGYLYIDNKTTLTNQIESLQEEVIVLRSDYKKLNDKFIETLESYLNKKAIRNYMPFQEGDVHKTFADISSFKTDYSYQPTTDIKIGLEKWVKWYKIYHRK